MNKNLRRNRSRDPQKTQRLLGCRVEAGHRGKEKGMALILTMIVLAVLSVMAVSFMFLSQSETWSTLNYRLTAQARDAAEAGLNSAGNYIVNTYTPPAAGTGCASDVLGCYTMTTYPVQVASTSKPVGLSCAGATWCSSNMPSNLSYPVAAVQDAFYKNSVGCGANPPGCGSLSATAGNLTTKVSYAVYAELLSMRSVTVYGGATGIIQTWLLVSDGTVNIGIRSSQVEVSAILEKPIAPTFNYAAFASSNQCSALTFSQAGTVVESYDSSLSGQPAGVLAADGNVGTNGNLTISSNATIDGSLSTPATGTGTCTSGAGGASTAETACAGCTVSGGLVALPQPISYPLPALPSPMPPITAESAGTDCGTVPNCTNLASKKIQLDPGNYGQVSIGSAMTDVHFHNGGGTTPGVYNMDYFSMGNANLIIDSGPVILNITGCATLNAGSTACATYLASALDITSTANVNASYNPSWFQVQYAGPGTVNVKCGGTVTSLLVYAPAAAVNLTANGSLYGAVIGNTVTEASGATIYYDRALQDGSFTVGNYVMSAFSWARF